MKKTTIVPLALIVLFLIALGLRLYKIDTVPLYADEASQYKLLHILSASNQNFVVGLYNRLLYGTLSFTWLFGLSVWGVRFSSALFGSIIALGTYLFARTVSGNKAVGLIAAALSVFVPWLFMISRIGHSHVTILVLMVIFQAYFFLRSVSIRDYLLSLFFLSLTLIFYPSMVIITPFVVLLVLVYLYQRLPQRRRLPILAVSALILTVLGVVAINRFNIFSLGGRGLDLAIWRDVNTPYEIDRYRAFSWGSSSSLFSFGLPPEKLANKLVYNRTMANISIFTRNYLSFFSPDWLFLKGDPILRHSTGQVGAIFPFLAPFMLYGAFKFFQIADRKKKFTFLLWILVSPVPAAITKDGSGYLLRVVTMLPFLTYFCALGLVESFNLVKKNWRWPYGILLFLIGLYSAYYFFYGYFHVYPALSARAYEYGFKELSDFQVNHGNKTMLVIWDGYYPLNHFLFWQKISFTQYEKMNVLPIVIGETTYWKTLPNLYFANIKQAIDLAPFIKQYQPDYLVLPDRYFIKYPEDLKLPKDKTAEILYPDKTTAFSIYTLK